MGALLAANADVSKAKTTDGAAPLCIAAISCHEGMEESLVDANADVNKAMTSVGFTQLFLAAQSGGGRGRGETAVEGHLSSTHCIFLRHCFSKNKLPL